MTSLKVSVLNPYKLELIIGNMYSGKSKKLIERAQRAKKQNIPVFVFKPTIDKRSPDLLSKAGLRIDCSTIDFPKEILLDENLYSEGNKLILIDEAQFFDESIIYVIQYLKFIGNNVVVAGLNRDFRGQPFNVIGQLMLLADKISFIHSKCSMEGCPNKGTRTQRLRNGKPDSLLSKTVEIEFVDDVEYLAVCEAHHKIPDFKEYIEQKLGLNLR